MKKPRKNSKDAAIRELILTVEMLRHACEHAEGKRKEDNARLINGMMLGIHIAAKYGRALLPDYQQPAFWDEGYALAARHKIQFDPAELTGKRV